MARMECPHCGARVPRGAAACPECGSDDETGWADGEEQAYAEVDIPDAYDPDQWEKDAAARDASAGARTAVVVALVGSLLLAAAFGLRALLR